MLVASSVSSVTTEIFFLVPSGCDLRVLASPRNSGHKEEFGFMHNYSVSTHVDIFAFLSHTSLPVSHVSHTGHHAFLQPPEHCCGTLGEARD